MNTQITTALGLPDDTSDADVIAAVSDLIRQHDAAKLRLAELQAIRDKKLRELRAIRIELFLNSLIQSYPALYHTLEPLKQAIMRELTEETAAANPLGCNGAWHHHVCPHKGTTREYKTPGSLHRVYKVDQNQPMYKQITDLASAIERASRDGARLEAVITRPEFGELTLDCGNPGKTTHPIGKGGHGVQHALEARHDISPRAIAETLLHGNITPHHEKSSRLVISWKVYQISIEREIHINSGRISNTRAKIQTAMRIK